MFINHACEFMDRGWDVKHMFRLMVTSAAYRQAATTTSAKLAIDRENRLLSRGPRFRMDAEMIRDYVLAASGTLARAIAEDGGMESVLWAGARKRGPVRMRIAANQKARRG